MTPLETPALLFSMISLLFLSYTSKYLAIGTLIRTLHKEYKENPEKIVFTQIQSLKIRVSLIKRMKEFCLISLFCGTCSIISHYLDFNLGGKVFFSLSLFSLLISLIICLKEVSLSVAALNIRLTDISEVNEKNIDANKAN
ncbi:hypothetical protein AB834_03050 [PVC group bacterium (ex Bugula neritina AB1)]|nr:hypothetical protein AB834_03050 [PVC group bacterium (ex Bugula neritina AB1)]